MPTDTDLAYIAGLFDGEAHIGIKKEKPYGCTGRLTPGYHARIFIRMVDEAAVRFVAETLGGRYFALKRYSNVLGKRPLFEYEATNARAGEILGLVLPYLRVKRRNAENILALRALQAEGRKHRTKITSYHDFPNLYGTVRSVAQMSFSDEYVERCEALYLESKRLNHAPSE